MSLNEAKFIPFWRRLCVPLACVCGHRVGKGPSWPVSGEKQRYSVGNPCWNRLHSVESQLVLQKKYLDLPTRASVKESCTRPVYSNSLKISSKSKQLDVHLEYLSNTDLRALTEARDKTKTRTIYDWRFLPWDFKVFIDISQRCGFGHAIFALYIMYFHIH